MGEAGAGIAFFGSAIVSKKNIIPSEVRNLPSFGQQSSLILDSVLVFF